jgi:hypothetical protein
VETRTVPLYELCNSEKNLREEYFLFANQYDYWFYQASPTHFPICNLGFVAGREGYEPDFNTDGTFQNIVIYTYTEICMKLCKYVIVQYIH